MSVETRDGIRKFRDRLRLNQFDLAKKLGIIQQNVSKWEAGKSNPSFLVAKKLVEMGITVEELFGIDYNAIQGLTKKEETTNKDLLPKILSQLENMSLKFDNINLRLDNLESKNNQPQRGLIAKAG